MEELVVWIILLGVGAAIKSASKKQKAQPTKYPQAPVANAAPKQQPASMASALPTQQERPAQPAQPTVHTHLELDCDTHDAPTSGSLGAVRTEGTDPCHDEQLSNRRLEEAPAVEPEAQPGLTLEWSGDALIRSFVMQEVLTRPAQRRTR